MLAAWCRMPHEFKEIADSLRSDGALRDFHIRGANRTDWNVVLRRVSSHREAYRFTVDGESQDLPQAFEAIEKLRQKANPSLSIMVDSAYVNCHFFWDEEIEFDFRPEDFRTLERWSALCGFFQEIVDVVGKAGVITYENAQDDIIDRFEPRGTSRVAETPPADVN
jgi:hypothetical protein